MVKDQKVMEETYIPGYWTDIAKQVINNYKLKYNAKVLDIIVEKDF